MIRGHRHLSRGCRNTSGAHRASFLTNGGYDMTDGLVAPTAFQIPQPSLR